MGKPSFLRRFPVELVLEVLVETPCSHLVGHVVAMSTGWAGLREQGQPIIQTGVKEVGFSLSVTWVTGSGEKNGC